MKYGREKIRVPGLTRKEIKDRMFEQASVHLKFLADHDHTEHCRQFGCGRKLTLQEKLFGVYCVNHTLEKQKVRTMIEHLNFNNLSEREVFLYWKDHWCRIPFYLLEDIADQWDHHGRRTDAKILTRWVEKNQHSHKPGAVSEIKAILETEMQFMEAYKYFTDQPLTSDPDDGDIERIKDEKFMEEWFKKNYPNAPEFKSKTA